MLLFLMAMVVLCLKKSNIIQIEYVWSGALSNGNIADIGSYILRIKGDEKLFV